MTSEELWLKYGSTPEDMTEEQARHEFMLDLNDVVREMKAGPCIKIREQEQVEEFQRARGRPIHDAMVFTGDPPYSFDMALGLFRHKLIEEEAKEFYLAVNNRDPFEMIDALCDLLYVVYGSFVEFGVNAKPYWDEVHRTNMAKFPGGVCTETPEGKVMKPRGWQPPDIKTLFYADLARRRKP